MTVQVTRTYLELRSPDHLRRASPFADGAVCVARRPCTVERYRHLYRVVGARWRWRDRLAWTDERLAAHLASIDVAVWELEVHGELAGYFELHREDDGGVEIAYFGLLESFIGRGLGAAMLTAAVDRAWAMRATRVWLHTCTLDAPSALPNYLARGFEIVRTESYEIDPDANASG